MIEHVYRRASAASRVHGVVVATDDERIAEAVRGFGGAAIMTRPEHVSGTDRIAEAVASLPCRIVVNIQGDEPLIEPQTIDAAVAPLLNDESVAMSTLSRPFVSTDEFQNPNVVKVVTNNFGDALYFSRAPIPGAAAHIGLYVYRRQALLELAASPPSPSELAERLEQLRALANGLKIRVVPTAHTVAGVDTPEDLERVRSLMMATSRN
jgi:3-deoxy-manno-octulosonate cytidylyltransferase (CMP-KDO synthetase)